MTPNIFDSPTSQRSNTIDVAGVINLHGYPAVISMLGTVFVCLYGYHTADL